MLLWQKNWTTYIVQFCYKIKNKEKRNIKNTIEVDIFVFVTQYRMHSKNVCKWIMNSEATKHMTLHRVTFNTYEVISPHNVYLGNDNMAEAIGIGSIVAKVETKGKND